MIRMIQRRLIIPRGDTGSFTIPTAGTVNNGDLAIFSIYDPSTHKTVFEKEIPATPETITISLEHNDTVNLIPKKYLWDIKLYLNPIRNNEGEIESADSINSYYAAFSLPICEIKEVAQNI